MATVVAVKLRYNPKVLWFDPVLGTYAEGDHVIVETERGREIGLVTDGVLEVTDQQIKELKTPLKPVIRALSESDYDHVDLLDAKGREAMPLFRELISKHGLDMKPVEVEYLFAGDKAVFYFSSDERIDFRELVRELASSLHIRVDMRQIGVRDEARMLGGLAHCGEELCCTRLGGEFQPVSIRMAKEQDLPLNPAKISGACGRLMCCLRYEFEAYKDFKSRAPKKNALIETPLGLAKVIDYNTPREMILLRFENGKSLSVPLKDFDCEADKTGCVRPCRVSREAIDRCATSGIMLALNALDKEAALNDEQAADVVKQPEKPLLRRRRRNQEVGTERAATPEPAAERTSSAKGDGKRVVGRKEPVKATAGEAAEAVKQKPRPGQRSSGLRNRTKRPLEQERSQDNQQGQARNSRRPGQQDRSAQKDQQRPNRQGKRPQQQADKQAQQEKPAQQDKTTRQEKVSRFARKPRKTNQDAKQAPQSESTDKGLFDSGRKRRRRHAGDSTEGSQKKDGSQG